jgi:hypothetical protein
MDWNETRDKFAVAALTGLMTSFPGWTPKERAEAAYRQASEMLLEKHEVESRASAAVDAILNRKRDYLYDKIYEVVSPPYCMYEQTASDPSEWGCDVVYVEAKSNREAKVKAVQKFRRLYPQGYISDGEHPFKGLKVREIFDGSLEDMEYFIKLVKE